jgi:hypothetical protein
MLIKSVTSLLLILGLLAACAQAQIQPKPQTLVPGQTLEQEIAGGESHPYPIKLSAGQFMRLVTVQNGTNIVIALADPDGKEIWEANFSGNFGGQESLSYEATTPGE